MSLCVYVGQMSLCVCVGQMSLCVYVGEMSLCVYVGEMSLCVCRVGRLTHAHSGEEHFYVVRANTTNTSCITRRKYSTDGVIL